MKTEVIIVGAGPTGLALAAQLIRYGIDFVIFDKNEGTTPYSKAIGVQARTLEIYEQIDLADELIRQGVIAERARMIEGGKVRGEVYLKEVGAGMSPYPFLLIVEQGKHEKLLHEFVRNHGRDVRWQTRLESLTQDEAGVRVTVKTAGGAVETFEGKFLVGCDGAKSFVRHALGLTFGGSTFERLFYVADAQVEWSLTHDSLYVCLAKRTITAFFPMTGGEKHFRIVGTFPEGYAGDEGEILYEEIERQIKADTELDLDIHGVNWFSVYKVHTRHVDRFLRGRCFLAGDSAHIHTPAGAQGMNTGIQDGYNLAWKLWLVLRGRAGETLLETYNEERLANARELLKTTDQLFDFAASPDALASFFRTKIFPHLAGFLLSIDAVKKFAFPRVSQIGISYQDSSLSTGAGSFAVRAGDRMPYFLVEGASIYDRLRAPKFHLLTFFDSRGPHPDFPASEFSDLMDFEALPLDPNVAEIFGAERSFMVLVRPDNYIGLLADEISPAVLRTHLSRHYRQV